MHVYTLHHALAPHRAAPRRAGLPFPNSSHLSAAPADVSEEELKGLFASKPGFKSLKVKTTVSKAQVKNMAECQKNCGIDFGKCLITTFDMKECLKTQAACALDCLKSVKKSFL